MAILRKQPLIFLFIATVLLFTACGQNQSTPTPTGSTAVPPTRTEPTPTLANGANSTAVPPTDTPPTAQPEATATQTAVPTEPRPTPESTIELPGATVPPGFSFIKFADIYRPTGLAFDAAGRLYVTSFDGTVHILQDENGDGRSDRDTTFATGFSTALGITLRPGTNDVYVSSTGQITLLRDDNGDDVADTRDLFVSGLPNGLHQNDNLQFGLDGWLYMGVGSTCDTCTEADSRSASIMRFNVDTGESEVIAHGLRNPYDIAFYPGTSDLFATDNGRDDLGLDSPFEELNQIIVGGDYGWPNCWNEDEGSDCAGTETAVAFFAPHSSANGLDFYSGSQFPAEYQNNAFVAIFGTFLTDGVYTGVARVQLTPDGDSYQSTVSWFAQWPDGRPLPLIVGPDGALYVGDYINSVIYRISYGP
ncbi:MAG: PQQ-dependent sugar dehydrogenase [Anaerolineales bacterium]|nr:PQQ-dependent sugar dehydrogenase [Anaerolineales bacterium]